LGEFRHAGLHRQAQSGGLRTRIRQPVRLAATIIVAGAVLATTVAVAMHVAHRPAKIAHSAMKPGRPDHPAMSGSLSAAPGSYIGLYPNGVPNSYAGVKEFTVTAGVAPNVVPYYSGWMEPFQVSFATTAAKNGAVPLVQIEPSHIDLAAVSSGRYDDYLSTYAKAIHSYRNPVILSFGHEMNGHWYSWGYRHTSATVFVAAWRHIVRLFRTLGATNVTWLWTVNTIHRGQGVPSPRAWWPGNSYVTWVGIDGYYTNRSATFASVFGPTIVTLRALTHDPILIAETAVAPAANQPAKIDDLFAGVHLYGLLGFVWFDSVAITNWTISTSAAFSAFRRAAETYRRRAS
jgi:mannan endo-1,4-beta-mannosidase